MLEYLSLVLCTCFTFLFVFNIPKHCSSLVYCGQGVKPMPGISGSLLNCNTVIPNLVPYFQFTVIGCKGIPYGDVAKFRMT